MQPLSICLILMMICQFSGCAKTTSTASVAPITDGGALPAQKTQSELIVGADPYYSNRQKSMFGQDMSQTGLLPVMVYVQNNGVQPLKVTPNLISLEFQDGGEVQATALPNDLLPPPPPAETTGAKAGRVVRGSAAIIAAASFPYSLPFILPILLKKSKPHLQKEYENKELREVTLAKVESAQGFVYFYIPQGVQHAVGAHLIVHYLPAQGRSGEVRVTLGGI